MQFGSKDWGNRERSGPSDREHYSGHSRSSRGRTYSSVEGRGTGGSRYHHGDASRGTRSPAWSTSQAQQWDTGSKDYDPRIRSYDYMHRSTYTGTPRGHATSPTVSRSYGSPDWNPENPTVTAQSSTQERFTEESFSDPGEDVPGGSPDRHSRPTWSTQTTFTRPPEQYDYQHERVFHSPSTYPPKEGVRVEDKPPLVHPQQPMSGPSGCAANVAEPLNVLELANKISSLGPLIRDPRLLTRILKITKTDETSPKREDANPFPLSSSAVPNVNDLQWSKPAGNTETVDQLSRQHKLTEYSQKYKIVKKSQPPPPPTIPPPLLPPPSPLESLPPDLISESLDQSDDVKQATDHSGSKPEPKPSSAPSESSKKTDQSPTKNKEVNENSKKQSDSCSPANVPSAPSFASKAQMLVKDSFIKRKQEGRAKMSTPTRKADNKQNQALLKLVVGSKDDGGNTNKSATDLQNASGPNPTVKLPGLKNILNSVMKTSISQVLRNKMDSPKSKAAEEKKKSSKDVSQKQSDTGLHTSSNLETVSGTAETKGTNLENKDKDPVADTTNESGKEATNDDSKQVPKVNRARKGQAASDKSRVSSKKQVAVVTRKQAAMSTVFKHKKKIKKRHFRGGTYNLYLSSKKKKKKNKDSNQADDELSVEGTETTGSLIDSEDDVSYASEELMTASEKSFQDDEVMSQKPTSGQSTPEEKMDETVTPSEEVKSNVKLEADGDLKRSDLQLSDLSTDKVIHQDQKLNAIVQVKLEATTVCLKDILSEKPKVKSTTEQSQKDVSKEVEKTEEMNSELGDKTKRESAVLQTLSDSEADLNSKKPVNLEQIIDGVAKGTCDGVEGAPLSPAHSETVGSSAESHTLSDGEINKENTPFVSPRQTTIASSVKTRLRMKRRNTDSDHDGPEMVNGDSPFKKPKRVQATGLSPNSLPPVPSHPVTNLAKIASGNFPKLDVIYDHKRLKYSSCTCQAKAVEARNDNTNKSKIYCQAVDSIDDKLLGCCNIVEKPHLVRPSVKIPFTALCEVHLWRLKHHHCCPICGVFCSQGLFMQCTAPGKTKSQIHLFHKCCIISNEELGIDLCPHCGGSKDLKSVQLELNTPSAPTFYLSQKPLFSEPRAKMTINRHPSEEKVPPEDLLANKYMIPETEKVLSSAGLPVGPERSSLDKLLEQFNAKELDSSKYNQHHLFLAAKDGNVEKTLLLLTMGFDANAKENEIKDIPLHAACMNGHLAVAHLLIQAGASIDSLDEHLYTPLMLAVENHHVELSQYLVKCGAQLLAKGEDGMTCLHLAARCGSVPICKILLDTGRIMPNVQDDGGWTPIVWAAEHSHLDIVRLMVERGADPNMKDNELNIALHWSAFSGNVDISHLFLDLGSDLTAANEHGDTPLHIAARQNKYACVVLFLARGANIDTLNKENETPIMCCGDTESQTYMALLMNKELKKFARNRLKKSDSVIHSDISKGKEQNLIQCVNGVDDEKVPTDYMYVTENCETSSINIDRTITSLQSCRCDDDCTSPNCTCATLSFKCWFDNDGRLLPEFNLSDPPMIFECNRACLCWKNCNNRALQHGILCRLELFRTHNKGWGVRTLKDIPKGTFICEYIGEIITDGEADQREDDSYLFDLDNRFGDGETYCLDARYYGNISRFVNHQCEPNLVPVKVFVDHQDLSFPRIAFFSSRDIYASEELGFDYGEKFWVIKYKSFTCDCGSPNCKYSQDTIHQTLENYYRRLKEEHADESMEGPQETQTVQAPQPQ